MDGLCAETLAFYDGRESCFRLPLAAAVCTLVHLSHSSCFSPNRTISILSQDKMLSLRASRPARTLLRSCAPSSTQLRYASKSSSSESAEGTPELPLARVSFKKKSVWNGARSEQGPTAESVMISGGPDPDRVA